MPDPIDSGARILQVLGTMQQQMTQQFQQVNEQLGTLQQQVNEQLGTLQQQIHNLATSVDDIRRENMARDANHLAVTENALLIRSTESLQPLYSMVTGEVIPDFPAQVIDVDRLSDPDTRRILRELRLSRDGKLQDRRWRILLATGATGIRL